MVDWLRQFEDDDLIESGLRTPEEIRLVGRSDTGAALSSFIRSNQEYRNGFVCRFGGGKDSSAIITYYAQDVARECTLRIGELEEALSSQDAPIVFLDDFIGTAHQAVTILESWLGEGLSFDLHEHRGDPLSADMTVLFKRRKLAFIFAAGTDAGAELFRRRLAKLHLDANVHVQIDSAALPMAFGKSLYRTAVAEKEFKARCRRVGKAILSDRGRTSHWIKDRVLGYGNNSFLVIFPYNTPTQTLTCLGSPVA